MDGIIKGYVGDDGFSFTGSQSNWLEASKPLHVRSVIEPASNVYIHRKKRNSNLVEMNQRKFYKVGESVVIKQYKVNGIIVGLNIQPKKDIYKAIVKYPPFKKGDQLITSEFDLWEIDKVYDSDTNMELYSPNEHTEKRYKRKRNKKSNQKSKGKKSSDNPLLIKVKYFDKDTYFSNGVNGIEFIEQGDWIDLRSAENHIYTEGSFIKVRLGVAMELPEGYEAHVVPRGSSFKNYGTIQVNSPGIVDESYKGDNDEWFIPLFALREGKINKGDRVCQFRIVPKMPRNIKFKAISRLDNPDRSAFGSTGRN
ncbi:hypothetical protein QB910_000071 [Dabrowskivirus KKP3916]|uniref:dUTPase-like domain-containing protein n=1 Tax=Alicyclobacillus phage KKP_3916 TaxID=3040651 RepID=A0AAT9V7P9_9CAUD|nr:hypothetical protein QB910_000071 [Alicyclobacillus phage KKP 3916]